MSRPRYRPRKCRYCGRGESDGVSISYRGMCLDDAKARAIASADQIRMRQGPFFERWARRSFMAAQRAVIAAERGEA